jgi:hypothetical protein
MRDRRLAVDTAARKQYITRSRFFLIHQFGIYMKKYVVVSLILAVLPAAAARAEWTYLGDYVAPYKTEGQRALGGHQV